MLPRPARKEGPCCLPREKQPSWLCLGLATGGGRILPLVRSDFPSKAARIAASPPAPSLPAGEADPGKAPLELGDPQAGLEGKPGQGAGGAGRARGLWLPVPKWPGVILSLGCSMADLPVRFWMCRLGGLAGRRTDRPERCRMRPT